jgi:GNAT superfamily N-acetyltransferase
MRPLAPYRDIPQGLYFSHIHAAIERILSTPGIVVLVAVCRDVPDEVLGYCVSAKRSDVLYCFVKRTYQRMGIATALLSASLDTKPRSIAVQSWEWGALSSKLGYNFVTYNPFLIWERI